MRTIRVELEAPVGDDATGLASMFGGGCRIRISTEVIVDDDADVREAGAAASQVVTDFVAGYSEATS